MEMIDARTQKEFAKGIIGLNPNDMSKFDNVSSPTILNIDLVVI